MDALDPERETNPRRGASSPPRRRVNDWEYAATLSLLGLHPKRGSKTCLAPMSADLPRSGCVASELATETLDRMLSLMLEQEDCRG